MTYDPSNEDRPDEVVQLDTYGLKARFRSGDLGEPHPKSLEEVREQVKAHLLRLLVAPTRLIVETIEGATRLIRGISGVPSAIGSRIRRGHDVADRGEVRQQERQLHASSGDTSVEIRQKPSTQHAEELARRLEEIMAAMRAQGRDAAAIAQPDGKILFVLGTSRDARAAIEAAARDDLPQLSSGAPQEQSED